MAAVTASALVNEAYHVTQGKGTLSLHQTQQKTALSIHLPHSSLESGKHSKLFVLSFFQRFLPCVSNSVTAFKGL